MFGREQVREVENALFLVQIVMFITQIIIITQGHLQELDRSGEQDVTLV